MTPLRSILRGALPLTLLEALSIALALLTLPYLMRVLEPSGFGLYAFGLAAGGAMTAVVDHGFNQLGPREVAQTASGERTALLFAVQMAKVQLALLALALLVAIAWVLDLTNPYGPALLAAATAVGAPLLFPQWYLQGLQHYRALAVSLATARLICVVATLTLVQAPADAPLAVLLQVLTGCVAGLIALGHAPYRASLRGTLPPWGARCARSWEMLRHAGPLFLSTVAVSAYTTCVPLLLGVLTSPAAVGLFGVGDRIRGAMQALLAPIGTAAFPKFSVWLRDDRQQGLAAARRLLLLQLVLGSAATLAVAFGAQPVILILAGDAFLPAVPAAQLLGLCIVFTAVSNTLGMQLMLPLQMDRAFSVILGLGAGLGLGTVWLLAPHWGAVGAAVAVVSAEALVALLMMLWLRHRSVI